MSQALVRNVPEGPISRKFGIVQPDPSRLSPEDRKLAVLLAVESGMRSPVPAEQPDDPADSEPAAEPSAFVEPAAPNRPIGDNDVHIGDGKSGPVGIDLARLIEGRMVVQGNSGAGKSMLLRRLFEQAFGRVQQLLVDPDGEFSTLKEHFDVAVLSAADVGRIGGRAFAAHLREHRYSAVLDLSDATAEDRLAFVADLAEGLIEAPEQHWFPLLVLVDEAQTFAPHYDTGDVEADTRKRTIAALADLMGRGRKRGIAGVIATQRIAETSKSVIAKATNYVVGRTIFDRDIERAGAHLGLTVGHSRALRSMADGEFLAIGPAIAGPRRIRFKAGPVKSRHKGAVPVLSAPPPLSAAAAAALLGQVSTTSEPVAFDRRKPGKRGRAWDPGEDQIIKAGYADKLPVRAIADRLEAAGFRRRSNSGVSTRAHDLGLVSAVYRADWSDAEDQIVADAYAREVRIIDIVGLLAKAGYERGRVSIQMRAIALGITRDRVNYWTEPEKAIAIAGLQAGKPYREILQDLRDAGYERGHTAIFKFAAKNNFNRAPDPWTPEDIARLKELYAAKTPVKQIAAELGKPIASVRTRASNLGLKQRVGWTPEEYELLREASESGTSLIDAAARIGRPYVNVARQAAVLHLSFKPNRPSSQRTLT